MVSPILALIIVLVVFIVIDTIGRLKKTPFLSDIFIFLYFLWAFANLDDQNNLAIFYLFASLIVLLFRVTKTFVFPNETIQSIGGFTLKGKLPLLGIFLGVAIYGLMRVLQGQTTGSIIGTPSFAIASQSLTVTSIMLLGVVENRMFLSIFELFGGAKTLYIESEMYPGIQLITILTDGVLSP